MKSFAQRFMSQAGATTQWADKHGDTVMEVWGPEDLGTPGTFLLNFLPSFFETAQYTPAYLNELAGDYSGELVQHEGGTGILFPSVDALNRAVQDINVNTGFAFEQAAPDAEVPTISEFKVGDRVVFEKQNISREGIIVNLNILLRNGVPQHRVRCGEYNYLVAENEMKLASQGSNQ